MNTITFSLGIMAGVGLVMLYSPMKRWLEKMGTDMADNCQDMKNELVSKGSTLKKEASKMADQFTESADELRQDIIDEIQSIDTKELSPANKKAFSKIKGYFNSLM